MKKLDLFDFKKFVDEGKPFIVKFKSDDCHICVDLEEDYELVAKSFPQLQFFDVDVDEEDELSSIFIDDGVPTLYYVNGKNFKELPYPEKGFDKKSLTKVIKGILNAK